MKKILFCVSLVLSSLLMGCSNTEHLKKNLVPVATQNQIILTEDAALVLKSPIGIPTTFGLNRGIYRPEWQNEFGTFYKGSEGCVMHIQGGVPMGPYDGGVWMPKDKINNQPAIYYYFNYNIQRASDAGRLTAVVILEAFKGDITFVPPSPERTFLSDIRVTNF